MTTPTSPARRPDEPAIARPLLVAFIPWFSLVAPRLLHMI
jgi:hypothetical protein